MRVLLVFLWGDILLKYVIKKLLLSIIIIFGISIILFVLVNLQPGNPYSAMIGPGTSPEVFEEMLRRLGYYDPLYIRYFKWLGNIFSGELGYSINFSRPVGEVILNRLPNTLLLSAVAILFTLIISVSLGYISAISSSKIIDKLISGFSFFGVSIPTFFIGLLAIKWLSFDLGIFPTSGMQDIRSNYVGVLKVLDVLYHVLLPAIVLAITQSAGFIQYVKSAFLEVVNSDYIIMAIAKGESKNKAILKHGFRNILNPILTIFFIQVPTLFSGALMTETIFVWPGLGRLSYEAVMNRDYPLVMGILLISAIIIIISNLLADILYAINDKRIRY